MYSRKVLLYVIVHTSTLIILSLESFPLFPTSIMDGYAVFAPLDPGVYKVQDRVHAGSATDTILEKGIIMFDNPILLVLILIY